MQLADHVVIILGASRGIGRDMAIALARGGASVAVCARSEVQPDPRLPGTIASVAAEVEAAGGKALALKVDATSDDDLSAMAARTLDHFGRVTAFIYNPSVLIPGTTRTVQPRHLDLLWRLNLRAPILAIRSVLNPIRDAGGGHVVYVSSVAGVFLGPGPYSGEQQTRARTAGAFYGMTKAGFERYAQSLAAEVQADNIAVNVLSPRGRIRTPGNVYAQNSKENPNLDFEEAVAMGKGIRWLLEQDPQSYTGNIVFDEDLVAAHGL